MKKYRAEIRLFEERYNSSWEDEAQAQRGEFISRFPISSLAKLDLKSYAIGQNGRETFCYWIEPGTEKWARITGATAAKFGIYYGRTNSDATKRYRYTVKFGPNLPRFGAERRAFKNIRAALLSLIESGRRCDLDAIDGNPLSPMVRAKVLSLYFPETYVAICSTENLFELANALRLEDDSPSGIQHSALRLKRSSGPLKRWSDLKYAAFLYEVVLGKRAKYLAPASRTRRTRDKQHPVVDFEARMRKCWERGDKSEAYALNFERMRLKSLGLDSLIGRIEDRTKQPGFGYDFRSFSTPRDPRYIEVKTLTPNGSEGAIFFVSANEYAVAHSSSAAPYYYFYLVAYAGDEPVEVRVVKGSDLYKHAELKPQNYRVHFEDIG